MPGPQAWPALGTAFAYSTDGTAYTDLGECTKISGAGGGEVGERDTTVLRSIAHTSMPTIPDNGEVSIDLNWDPTDLGHQQLQTWKDHPPSTLPFWKATFATLPTPKTAVFNGWVKKLDGASADGVDANLTMTLTVRVSGLVTYA